jgi:molybdenum cofactor guanylyltransferase
MKYGTRGRHSNTGGRGSHPVATLAAGFCATLRFGREWPARAILRWQNVATTPAAIIGTILAGGQARRLGGVDKGLIEVAGRPMIEWIIEALAPQVDAILINANRNPDRYCRYGFPVIGDLLPNHQGPLAGFAAAMAEVPGDAAVLTVPCDSPAPPPDLAARLTGALEAGDAELAVAHDGERLQPVYALIPAALRESLNAFLASGERKIDLWYARHRMATADFSDCPERFLNLNRPEDLAEVQRLLHRPGA